MRDTELLEKNLDFRRDTVTLPSLEMRQTAAKAELENDVKKMKSVLG